MNTMGHKINNKLTNVLGYKFANKMNTIGYKITPISISNSSPQQISNVMMPNASSFDKKIIDNTPSIDYRNSDKMRKKMRSRLTK